MLLVGFRLTITSVLCSYLGKGLRVESDVGIGTTFTFWVNQDKINSFEKKMLTERSETSKKLFPTDKNALLKEKEKGIC